MQISLSHLTAYDPSPVEEDIAEFSLMQLASRMYSEFNAEFSKLEQEFTVDGYLVRIPSEEPILPREKRIPEEERTTKWQKFAAERNIEKRKRDRFVYDPKTNEERPRYGKGRTTANSKEYDPIIEVKSKDVVDPFLSEKEKKKERIMKNKHQQEKNDRFNERTAKEQARSSQGDRKRGK